ncbi:MAG: glycosyltransferase family 8 protein [Planctomycetia bacterium]|nr:glycosyltransferase family 8 protein [Planctomycetia bacterium]
MTSTQAAGTVPADRHPIVVLAADENFAMPLAATVRSALDNLAGDRRLRVYVLDAGILEATKNRLLRSWPDGRYQVEWLRIDASKLAGLPESGHVNLVTYFRILMERVLPADLRRAIYLDADLVIRADLGRLWDSDFAGAWCLAAQDCAAPYMDAAEALANYPSCAPYMGSARPVPNFQALGLPADAAYFNAGVLLADLTAWRSAGIARLALECLDRNRQHVQWWDQYALNVVLADRWGRLDMRWNQGMHAYAYPTWKRSPFDRQTFEQLRDDPYIVHFTTRDKPWRPLCRHPMRGEFFKYVDRTAWAGWRPAPAPRIELFLERFRAQERRLRQNRKWLLNQARHWLRRNRRTRAA